MTNIPTLLSKAQYVPEVSMVVALIVSFIEEVSPILQFGILLTAFILGVLKVVDKIRELRKGSKK